MDEDLIAITFLL